MHRAKIITLFSLPFLICFCFVPFSYGGAISQVINYQGTLTDTSGNPVPDGQYGVVFNTYYDVATGGTSLWTETWNFGTTPIVTSNGNFNAMLGTHNPIPNPIPISFFNDHPTTYLGIKVLYACCLRAISNFYRTGG